MGFQIASPEPQVSGNAGTLPINARGRTAQVITTLLTPRGTAGSRFEIAQAGNNFYVILATGGVFIQPQGGQKNEYTPGTGLYTPEAPFPLLQISNESAENIVISVFVGFGQYIDNRLIVADPLVSDVAFPTYPVPNAALEVDVPDRTNTQITDANGTNYLAIARVGIYVTNLDTGVTYFIWNEDGSAGAVALLGIPPSQCSVYGANGNFKIAPNGAGNVNAIVSEVYKAIRPSLAL